MFVCNLARNGVSERLNKSILYRMPGFTSLMSSGKLFVKGNNNNASNFIGLL